MKKKNLLASIAVMGFVFAGSQLAVHADETEPTINNEAQPALDADSPTVEESAALPDQNLTENESKDNLNLAETFTNDIPTAEQKVADAEIKLDTIQTETKTVQDAVDQDEANLGVVKDNLTQAEETAKKADKNAEGIDDKTIQDNLNQVNASKDKLDKGQTDYSAAKNNFDSLSQKKDALSVEFSEIEATYTAKKTEFENIKKELAVASQKVLDAQNRVNELVLREDWKDEYDQAVETLKKLQKELADLQTAQKQLQTEADDLATRIDDKEEAKAGYETDIAAAVKTMAEKEAEKDSVQKEYDAAAKIQEDLDKAADKALAEVQTADMKVAEAELRLHDQNASLELAEKAKEVADNKALAAAQKRLDDAMAEYSKGSSGFFEYLKDQGNKDAERAFAIINAKGTEMQDGRNKNTDISEYTHLGGTPIIPL